ncbi:MAG: DUF3157 family protein [Chitinivibrionales bacterium]|nr:DUF3157 family protein [Chitinivibrionales bacterium]
MHPAIRFGLLPATGLLFLLAAKDIIVTLDDGRTVVLHEDKTWDFTEQRAKPQSRIELTGIVTQLVAQGTAKRGDVITSGKIAEQTAVDRMASNFRKYLKGGPVADAVLKRCITEQAQQVGYRKEFKQDNTAIAKLVLEEATINSIVACLNGN